MLVAGAAEARPRDGRVCREPAVAERDWQAQQLCALASPRELLVPFRPQLLQARLERLTREEGDGPRPARGKHGWRVFDQSIGVLQQLFRGQDRRPAHFAPPAAWLIGRPPAAAARTCACSAPAH